VTATRSCLQELFPLQHEGTARVTGRV